MKTVKRIDFNYLRQKYNHAADNMQLNIIVGKNMFNTVTEKKLNRFKPRGQSTQHKIPVQALKSDDRQIDKQMCLYNTS